jgi:RNA polymerase-binding protein DksA
MDHSDLQKSLTARLEELEQRLARLSDTASREYSADSAEQAQERENDEVVDSIGDETRAAIASIRSALARIAAGTYGTCEVCGEDIAAARLEAIPEATRCIGCAGA